MGEEAPDPQGHFPRQLCPGAGKGEGTGVPGVLRRQGWHPQARGRLCVCMSWGGGCPRGVRLALRGVHPHVRARVPFAGFPVNDGQSWILSIPVFPFSSRFAPVYTPECGSTLACTRTPSFHGRAVCPLQVECTSSQLVVQSAENAPPV